MVKEKKGTRYKCEDCGLVVVVDEPCGCEPVHIVCCSAPMVKMAPKTTAKKKPKSKK
jgi:hypothetical protein